MTKKTFIKRAVPSFLAIILIISMGMNLLNGFYAVQASSPDIDGNQGDTSPQDRPWPPEYDYRDFPGPNPPSPPAGDGSPYIIKKVWDEETSQWLKNIEAEKGDTITFNITVTPGTQASNMHSIVVKDWLPAGMEYINANPEPDNIENITIPTPPKPPRPPKPPKNPPFYRPNFYAKIITWNLYGITLDKGESTHIEMVGKVVSDAQIDSYPKKLPTKKNIAEVNTKATTYQNGCNNPRPHTPIEGSDSAVVHVVCLQVQPDIDIQKEVKKKCTGDFQENIEVQPGETVRFRLKVKNTGNVFLFKVLVKDYLPSNLEYADNATYDEQFVDVVNNTVGWCFPGFMLMPSDNITIEFDAEAVRCGMGRNNGTVQAGYFVTPGEEVEIEDYDTTGVNVLCGPEVSVEKYVKRGCMPPFKKQVDADIGDYVVFKIYANNTGETPLDLTVTDKLPVGLSYANMASPKEPDDIIYPYDGTIHYVWYFSNVDPSESIEITFHAVVESCGEHVNRVNVSGEFDCQQYVYDESQATVNVLCEPNITITKLVKENCCGTYQDSITVDQGQWITFKITITNTGDIPLDITLDDTLPAGLTYHNNAEVDGIPTEPTIHNGIYTWELTNITPQQTTIITFQATPNQCGTHTNTANATTTYQCQTITKQDTATVTVPCEPPEPDLSIEKKVSLDGTSWQDHVSAEVNTMVSFQITVTNTGNVDLSNVTVIDAFNNSVLTYVENSANYAPSSVTEHLIKWRHIDLAVNESRVIVFDATIVGVGTGINNATGIILAEETNDTLIMVYDTATVTGTAPGIIDVDKRVGNDGLWVEEAEVAIGDTVRFNISITNNGPGPYGLYDMYVNDTLPEILVYNDTVKGSNPKEISADKRNVSWFLFDQGLLEPGQTFSLEFTANVIAEGQQYNVVNVSSEYCDSDPMLYYDDDTAAVDAQGGDTSIVVTKLVRNMTSDWQNEVSAGYLDVVRFNITITNTGSTLLTSIDVNDTLPETLDYLGNATVDGETRDPNIVAGSVIIWDVTDGLPSGEQLFIEFDAEVTQNEGDQTVENQVVVVAENESTGQVTPSVSDTAVVHLIGQDDTVAPTSAVDAISPEIQSAPIAITATASDNESGVHNVTLYYCHSHNQIAPWSEWMKYETDSVSSDGWSWSFDAPNGTGYYRFYSRATDNAGNIEEPKDAYEASVRVVVETIEVSIEKPKDGCFYVNDKEVCKTLFGKTRIIGPITVEAATNDVVARVEFYVDDEMVGTDESAPFAYTIDDRLIGKHVIKVVAYGSNDNSEEAKVTAHMFNLGGSSDSEEGNNRVLNTHQGSQLVVSSDNEAKTISAHATGNKIVKKATISKNTSRNINNKLFISNRI